MALESRGTYCPGCTVSQYEFHFHLQPEGIHGLVEELVQRGVPHAVDWPLDAVAADRGVAVLRHHGLPRLAVDVGEAEHGVPGDLRMQDVEYFFQLGSS